jgi:glutamine synthetase
LARREACDRWKTGLFSPVFLFLVAGKAAEDFTKNSSLGTLILQKRIFLHREITRKEKYMVDFTEKSVPQHFGSLCFSDVVQRERLPKEVYKDLKKVQNGQKKLTIDTANVVANAMKDWAIENGATHFTHWFQPLTAITAEKHDSFISPTGNGEILMEFSGKELIQGEPDASSFPSGGLRATFEARGYTAWDTASPAFLKNDGGAITLCIPTAFVGYHGEALDKKAPLLKSMDALNIQALRVLRALGNTTATRVVTTVGPEQEYFLVSKNLFEQRPDLLLCGRTVIGCKPAKGQEMEDHYFGSISEHVSAFMKDLNTELWAVGVNAKTQHKEVAPNQFELACIYNPSNVALDSNQLVMETLKKVALRHDLVCLLHEKPFAGVNGSGKHNNWSMASDDGQNLLEPGKTPHENSQFLLFCTAVIEAVDTYAKLLRMSAANPGNDHRLGANEAPPAIISIFLGALEDILDKLAKGEKVTAKEGGILQLGANCLPDLPKDLTDRNRTSPFAFTGNKFEFRMQPSSDSIAGANVVLNTIVAEILDQYATKLEKAKDKQAEIAKIIKESYTVHKKVVFNGNGYSQEWQDEAAKRGLPNIKTTVEAIPAVNDKDAKALFTKHKVFTKEELDSRCVIYLEKYAKTINIESGVQIQMVKNSLVPAAIEYATSLAGSIATINDVLGDDKDLAESKAVLKDLVKAIKEAQKAVAKLEEEKEKAHHIEDINKHAKAFHDKVFLQMAEVRAAADKIEKLIPADYYPFPNYEALLFTL